MILKVVWRVLMGVLRVLEGCCRVFEVCLEGVWKNKIEVWNQSDPPPPLTKWFHKKSFFSQLRASLRALQYVVRQSDVRQWQGHSGRERLASKLLVTNFFGGRKIRAPRCLWRFSPKHVFACLFRSTCVLNTQFDNGAPSHLEIFILNGVRDA